MSGPDSDDFDARLAEMENAVVREKNARIEELEKALDLARESNEGLRETYVCVDSSRPLSKSTAPLRIPEVANRTRHYPSKYFMNTIDSSRTSYNTILGSPPRHDDASRDDYQPMLDAVRDQFALATKSTGAVSRSTPLFTTDVDGSDLWKAWLISIQEEVRQEYNCHACRRFVERYGGLVRIEEDGKTTPAIFSEAGGIYAKAFAAVHAMVQRACVNGVFVSSEILWGTPSTYDAKRACMWKHMHVVPPTTMIYRGSVLNSGQRAAELGEDFATLSRALAEFKIETIQQALSIAESESLYRSEKIKGRLQWLANLKESRGNDKHAGNQARRQNLVWLAVATAPAGFAHVRSSVIGPLLEDLEAGKSFAEVKRAFDAKMNPLQYQRPTAPPSVGNVKQAEAIVEKLGIVASLKRRYARIEDVVALWTPKPPKVMIRTGGVFGHLLEQKPNKPLVANGPTLTWEKFARTVLPNAESIEAYAVPTGHYTTLVTATDPDAPPIVQWDRHPIENEGRGRNPVTWYTYAGGRPAHAWNLKGGTYVPVTAVTLMPNMWQDGFEHQGKGAMFLLSGCRDLHNTAVCLFPEFLKSELHSVRSTIEAYSNREKLAGAEEASAAGLTVRAGSQGSVRVRVTANGVVTEYLIDRWD